MLKFVVAILPLLLVSKVYADVTVHILNPWRSDTCAWHHDSLRMGGNNYVGYYPGSGMVPEGGGWFYYAYPSTDLNFSVVNWCGPALYEGRVEYNVKFRLDSMLMQFSKGTKELWISIADSMAKPVISDRPPIGTKFIYFLNPWSIGAPLLVLQGLGTPRMRMDTSITRCGWFKYAYFGKTDSARVKFSNSLDGSMFSSVGIGNGDFIDLSAALKTGDTVWVLPEPYPSGVPAVRATFPGQSAPCERTLYLGAALRDLDSSHPDVGIGETRKTCGADKGYNAATPGMVGVQLDANGKPVLAAASPCEVTRFDWFTTQTISGQYTNATCINLKLTKNEDGLFEYDTNYFFPADSFRFLDDARSFLNPRYGGGQDNNGNPHNYYFTVELTAQFEYHKGQTFYFRGDDDVWVFINNRLVVDLGGVHNPMEGSVNLDTLGLTVGNTYTFKGFFVERNCCGSNFRMVTSLNLRTSSSLFTKVTNVSPGKRQFDMFEKVSKNNLSCDPGATVVDTEKAVVDFYIEGPPFPATPPTPLPTGTSYGGITILGNSTVVLDTGALTGLPPGIYLIRYYLGSDHSESGSIPFLITALPPEHLDILTDSIKMDAKKDAIVDSIVIGMFDKSTEAYAVIRDAHQSFLYLATSPIWTVGNPAVVQVSRSATVPSRCVLTKAGAGQTWLVVNHAPELKPDSVLVITHVQPPYPVVASGVMGDVNADIVPDVLNLTLSDTLKPGQRLDSVQIDYRGTITTIYSENITVKGMVATVRLPGTQTIDAQPNGTAIIFVTVADEVKKSERFFTDGVSPALIAAEVVENEGADADVLYITCSEPVGAGSMVGKQFQLLQQGTSDTLLLTVVQIVNHVNDSTFAVQVTSSKPGAKVKAGDRIRLIPANGGGTLTDRSMNKAHELNRAVIIGFRTGAASIAGTWYFDMNADGIIDRVKVQFRRKVAPSEIDTISLRRNTTFVKIPFSLATAVNDSVYTLPLGDALEGLPISTGGDIAVTVRFRALPELPRMSGAVDSAAPVIVSATLFPGAFTTSGERENDLLVVTLSEGVVEVGTSSFLLSAKKDGQRYGFILRKLDDNNPATGTYRFTVLSINPALPFASAGDTIWIDVAGNVRDSGGVVQSNLLNRRVLLNVEWPVAEWKVTMSMNPFTSNTTIPGQPFGGGMGIAIILTPTTPVDQPNIHARGIIYDKVGNMVRKADFEPFNNGFRMVWRGDNRLGRYVGIGTYLVMLRINDGSNRELVKTMMVGFKKE